MRIAVGGPARLETIRRVGGSWLLVGLAAAWITAGCGRTEGQGEAGAAAAKPDVAATSAAKEAPPLGRWSPVADAPVVLPAPTATILADGRVFVYGSGRDPAGLLFDPKAGAWSKTATAPKYPRADHGASRLPDGRVLVTGGQNYEKDFYVMRTADLYDPAQDSWSRAAAMETRRRGHSHVDLGGGLVLVAGGEPGGMAPPLRGMEVYDAAKDAWNPAGKLVVGRYGHATARLGDKTLLLAGGRGSDGPLGSAEVCTLGAATARCELTLIPGKRDGAAAIGLDATHALVTGGKAKGEFGDEALRIDAAAGRFEAGTRPDLPRTGHSMTRIRGGAVLVVGGEGERAAPSATLYDPGDHTWRRIPQPSTTRKHHAAVLLPDGGVLVVGGTDGGGKPLASAEIWHAL